MADESIIVSPDTKKENRVPPGQHLVDGWPTLQYGGVRRLDASSWSFRIFGLVDEEKTLSFGEFMSLPMVKVFSDIHCVTSWSKLDNLWEGVSTKAIMGLVRVSPEARFVVVHAPGGFSTNLSLDDFLQDDVIFAVKHDGKVLDPDHGYPVRLVVPRLYFWKSAKWANGLEFVAEDRPGFWESHGYHNHGDPWTEERYG